MLPPVQVITRRSSDMPVTTDPEVAAVLHYIRDADAHQINVNDLVRQTTLSRRALEMRFQKALGRSPHQEIRRVQLERAAMLLAGVDHSASISLLAQVIDQLDASTLLTDFAHICPKQHRRKRQRRSGRKNDSSAN